MAVYRFVFISITSQLMHEQPSLFTVEPHYNGHLWAEHLWL